MGACTNVTREMVKQDASLGCEEASRLARARSLEHPTFRRRVAAIVSDRDAASGMHGHGPADAALGGVGTGVSLERVPSASGLLRLHT